MQKNRRVDALIFRGADDYSLLSEVAEFRKRLFVDHLGWRLNSEGPREVDQFDSPHALYAVLSDESGIRGCFRAIRTDNSYLAESVFPQLATTRGYPKDNNYWEISRFGVWPDPSARAHASMLYALMFHFALIRRVKALVAVTDLFHERYLSQHDIRTRRYGLPQQCGTDNKGRPLKLVAGEIPVLRQDADALQNLFATLNGVSINDKSLVLGRSRLQA
jgi:N-acyl-L-homoserine lactone synthetase